MAGAIFPKCQHLDQRLTVWEATGQHVSDEIYQAGKLTPYAMAARGPGMAQPVSEQHDLEAVEIDEAVVCWAEERI